MKSIARIFFVLVAFALFATTPLYARAQSGKAVVVNRRDADITILPNGDVQFVETWVVDFQRGGFTFAFREIPINRLRDIVAIRVTENGEERRIDVERDDKKIKITWYFPETNRGANFFSDVHTFTLRYTVQGAMRIYPHGDQFWWKFAAKGRGYPIQSAHVTIHLPATFSIDQLKTTTYVNGDETGGGRVVDGQTVEFFGGPFPADTEWEIRAQFPHVIQAAPEEWQVWDDRVEQIAAQNNFYATVLGIIILFGGPLLLLVLWYLFGRDKPTTFRAEFLNAPPDETPPGVVGTLLDERADLQDIVATVADLAQRGYLQIRERDGFGTPEYERTEKSDADLAPFEKATMDALLRGNAMRRLEDVRGSFYEHLKDLEHALYDEVVTRGFFPRSPLATRDLYLKIAKWGALVTPVLGFCGYCAAFIFAPLAFFPLFALELFFIGLLGLSRVMPQRTEKGALAFAKWNAFKRYLANIEKYTNVSEAQEQFDTYLPYAIAFGLKKSWIEKFKQTTTPAPKWYIPYTPTSAEDWTWRNVDDARRTDKAPTRNTDSIFRPGALSSTPSAPIFSDASDGKSKRAPSLNELADSSFLALNSVSSNMFDFLNSSAQAFTTKPPTRSTTDEVVEGVGSFLNWVGSSSRTSSSSESSWSSSSSSSSSSWSGGSSSGGGGSGGGSSGFG